MNTVGFKRLGVFATQEEIDFIKHCQSMPVMGMTNPAPPGPGVSPVVPMFTDPMVVMGMTNPAPPGPGVSPVVPMFTDPMVACHNAALKHGLPEIPGYYGIDLSNGEFLQPLE